MADTVNLDADATQADAEGADSADKPPHAKSVSTLSSARTASTNSAMSMSTKASSSFGSPSSEKTISPPPILNGKRFQTPLQPPPNRNRAGSTTPPSVDSPSATVSESDGGVSSPPSRSMSNNEPPATRKDSSAGAAYQPPTKRRFSVKGLVHPSSPGVHPPPSQSSNEGGQKFNLKDLLGNGNNAGGLTRKASHRSSGSKRSDSERGTSSVGETTASLSKKYGVCDRIAIGKGATSVVRLVHKWDRSEEKLYAVKEFRKRRKNESEKEYVKKLTAEFCISSTLHHANIVETVDLVQDEQQRWCEVMEYCPGGDLYAAIKKGGMSPSEVECSFKQIISGVEYLHGQGVAHRDLKPENIYFDIKGALKIGDYGASTVYRLPWESTVHLSTGLCGSEPYIAPEQFAGKPYDARLVDIWACGIVYYCMQFQELPWRVAQSSEPLYGAYAQACATAKSENATPAMINSLAPRSCRIVLRKMLEPDPKKRWNVKDVIAQAWVVGIEVCTKSDKPAHVHSHARAMLQMHAEKSQRRE